MTEQEKSIIDGHLHALESYLRTQQVIQQVSTELKQQRKESFAIRIMSVAAMGIIAIYCSYLLLF